MRATTILAAASFPNSWLGENGKCAPHTCLRRGGSEPVLGEYGTQDTQSCFCRSVFVTNRLRSRVQPGEPRLFTSTAVCALSAAAVSAPPASDCEVPNAGPDEPFELDDEPPLARRPRGR